MYQESALPRRTFLGLELRASRGQPVPAEGIEVLRVTPGGTAARAGVFPGDRLLSFCGESIADPRDVAPKMRLLSPGAPVVLEVSRDGEPRTLTGEAVPLPLDVIPGAEVFPGHVVALGARLRTFLSIPEGASSPRPCILHLPGLGCASAELSLDPEDSTRRLIEDLSMAGLSTMRLERSGVGDSEGRPCQTLGFFDEVACYRAALDALESDPRVSSIVLFGQSIGGMIAPFLAAEGSRVAGVVLFGTSSLRWVDCIISATRRQRALAGLSGDELESIVHAWSEIHRMVCREGKTPREVFDERPDLAFLEGSACHGEWMYGRHVSFYQELERADLPSLFRTVAAPTLVLHGAFDWVCHPNEGRAIGEIGRDARFVELPFIGHDMRRHESLSQSFADPRRGAWDGSVVRASIDWMRSAGVLDDDRKGRPIEG